jgi:RNA polymerase sigma factor (sigma-70 family)
MTETGEPTGQGQLNLLTEVERERLLRRAHCLLGDMPEAEDVVQATILAVWQRLRKDRIDNPVAYLRKAVEWNALKRRARRRRGLSLEGLEDVIAAPRLPEGDENGIEPGELEVALEDLPERQQAVIRMKYYTGLTFREIAAALSISANTAASACRYGLAAMRKKMMKIDRHSRSQESR